MIYTEPKHKDTRGAWKRWTKMRPSMAGLAEMLAFQAGFAAGRRKRAQAKKGRKL